MLLSTKENRKGNLPAFLLELLAPSVATASVKHNNNLPFCIYPLWASSKNFFQKILPLFSKKKSFAFSFLDIFSSKKLLLSIILSKKPKEEEKGQANFYILICFVFASISFISLRKGQRELIIAFTDLYLTKSGLKLLLTAYWKTIRILEY